MPCSLDFLIQIVKHGDMENLRTTRDISAACSVTRAAVAIWREMGLPYHALGPRRFVYDADSVASFLDERLPERAKLWRKYEASR
jgi:hypothetical protein